MPNAVGEGSAQLEQVVSAVRASPKYRSVDEGFVRRLAAIEMQKRRSWKEAVKATKNKLHQVGGAYQQETGERAIAEWLAELEQIEPEDPDPAALGEFCRRVMARHASTCERLPILDTFYATTLGGIAPVESVLDLACGLNPLAIPWMPLAPNAAYYACDIYTDQAAFLTRFLEKIRVWGEVTTCDLTHSVPARRAQVALLLKTLPCLEQVDPSIGLRLLDEIQANFLLVSFPAHSLGGRSKGMRENYAARFKEMLGKRDWNYEQFEFPNEVAFLVKKNENRGPRSGNRI
ncbi:MAG TPA: hypothetical protein VMT46_20000 [Anaerolineaceae bacterium]|nr:hypothetical protein [Anaerolineaceae bacterium]